MRRDFAASCTIASCSASFRAWYSAKSASVIGLRFAYGTLLKVGPLFGCFVKRMTSCADRCANMGSQKVKR